MSGSELLDQEALVSTEHQALIGGIMTRNLIEIDFAEGQALL